MNAQPRARSAARRIPGGFTLVELLIVVMVIGILAAAVIPDLTNSSGNAELSVLANNLTELERAIELYYHQHAEQYPGARRSTDGASVATAGEARTSFLLQLTRYSNRSGITSNERNSSYPYGPYIRGDALPYNPINDKNSVVCDISTTDISNASPDGTSGWKFYVRTGILIPNDGEVLQDVRVLVGKLVK